MDTPNFSPFKVIIVHEDTIAALQAADVLKQVATHLKTKLGMEIDPWEICSHVWHFEWLEDPQLFEQAVHESVSADMIIISAEGRVELPACVRGWIESVLPRKQGTTAALVALLGGQRESRVVSLPCARYLHQMARQYNVDFFCNAPDRPAPVNSGMDSIFSGFEDEPAFAQAMVPNSSGSRGWGIND